MSDKLVSRDVVIIQNTIFPWIFQTSKKSLLSIRKPSAYFGTHYKKLKAIIFYWQLSIDDTSFNNMAYNGFFGCRINVKFANLAFIGKCYSKVHNYYASMSSKMAYVGFLLNWSCKTSFQKKFQIKKMVRDLKS